MSPELELLDQLLGGSLPLSTAAKLFADGSHFHQAMSAMLQAAEISLQTPTGTVVPSWQWSEILKSTDLSGFRVEITSLGNKRIA
jgi:hypothetical protein